MRVKHDKLSVEQNQLAIQIGMTFGLWAETNGSQEFKELAHKTLGEYLRISPAAQTQLAHQIGATFLSYILGVPNDPVPMPAIPKKPL